MKTAMDPRLPTWSLKKQGNAEICRQCHDMYEESIEIDHKPKSLNLPVISATIAIICRCFQTLQMKQSMDMLFRQLLQRISSKS